MKQPVKLLRLDPRAKLPTYGSAAAAGADLYALLDAPLTVNAGETVLVRTGVAVALPEGTVGLICARSGLATKRGLAPANKVGVIDADYRGELLVALHNHGTAPATLEPLERVAQLLIVPYITAEFCECDTLDGTARGAGGFGSTGAL
ncbi:MAG: dUTP diphosphatase [Clostridia bacterium]|nr:dUTP diphosphatase [Clostridia bacterium]